MFGSSTRRVTVKWLVNCVVKNWFIVEELQIFMNISIVFIKKNIIFWDVLLTKEPSRILFPVPFVLLVLRVEQNEYWTDCRNDCYWYETIEARWVSWILSVHGICSVFQLLQLQQRESSQRAGFIINHLRSSLKPGKVNALLFLSKNLQQLS